MSRLFYLFTCWCFLAHSSTGRPPPSSLLQMHFRNWDSLQDGALRLISGAKSEEWRWQRHREMRKSHGDIGGQLSEKQLVHTFKTTGVILGHITIWQCRRSAFERRWTTRADVQDACSTMDSVSSQTAPEYSILSKLF